MRTNALTLLVLLVAVTTPSGQPAPAKPGEWEPAGQSRVVTWQVKRVPPPSPLYVDVDDLLVCGAASSLSNELVTINYRLLRAADGVIVRGQFTVAPAATRAVKVQTQQLAEGFLLSVSVKAAVATTRGQTFARLFIGSGPFGAGQPAYMLMADYVTTAMAPAFPNGRQLAPTEGPGNPTTIHVAAPAAGAEISLTVPTNARWLLRGMFTNFTADGAGVARVISLVATTPVGTVFRLGTLQTIAPGAGVVVSFDGVPSFTPANAALVHVALPLNMLVLAATQLVTQTDNIDAGDTYVSSNWLVEEWLDNV